MKAVHTKEYFERFMTVLSAKYKKECNYEYDLSILLPDLSTLEPEARAKVEPIITKAAAQKVADMAKTELLKKMHIINEIKAGRAALGYTTTTQEVTAWHDLVEGFEFSCYMLSKFRTKYGLS